MATMNRSKSTTTQQIPIDYSLLTSIDEDLLLNHPETPGGSSASSLFETTCRCCGRQDCESLDIFNRAMKKLESDTRLAAEIGQGLLHKHESYVLEATQKQNQLEKELQKCHERVSELEQSLDDAENAKDQMENEKNRWSWEYQKRQKIMDETLADLEMVNDKCNQLTKEVESKNGEIEKLRIFKFMVRQSEIREETLRSKMDDTNQELAVCRKNELVLESKNKKLKMRYESLYTNYESLLKEISDKEGLAASLLSNVPGKIKSAQQKQAAPMQDVNNDDLIGLIKEISSSNYKLKSEILSYKEQLTESRNEITALTQKLDERADQTIATTLEDDVKSKRALTLPQKEPTRITKKALPKRATSIKESPQLKTKPIEIQKIATGNNIPTPTMSNSMPTTSSSSPVVHHHYHYYLKNKKKNNDPLLEEKDENESSSKSDVSSNNDSLEFGDGSKKLTDSIVLSPSSSVTTFKPTSTTRSPFILLLEHVTHVLERLKNSDIRALNRKLKRAFDINELSSMSNAVIENVLMDVETMDSRFLWVKQEEGEEDGFFPMLNLLRMMLKELGILRTTINELQVEYVKKVEESEHRVEEEILQKRALLRKQNASASAITQQSPLTWLTNMFYRNTTTTTPNSDNDNDNNNTHVNNNNSDNSIESVHYDKGSALTKTTANSSTMAGINAEIGNVKPTRKEINNTPIKSRSTTIPRSTGDNKQRRRIPYPNMMTSLSTGTDNRSIPITAALRSKHRTKHIDNMVLSVNPDRDSEWQSGTLSSSWLGGK